MPTPQYRKGESGLPLPKQGQYESPNESWIEARRRDLADEAQGGDAVPLSLPEPIGKQPAWIADPSPRKVIRVGRRGSKTRFGMLAALVGHGSGWPDEPQLPGILQGGDVLWVAVDYPQLLTVVWAEELVPRFRHLKWAELNQNLHQLKIPGKGTLFLRSAEALKGVRGMGKNLKGVIVDEAAHFDLEDSLLSIVLPTLLDNRGWLVLMSTTNAGRDGNKQDRTPSFFNVICHGIRQGEERFKDWVEFTGTAFDNPTIDPVGIQELISFYAPDSPQLKQEVYAELLEAGAGVALKQLSADVHLVEPTAVPSHWTRFGAFDWGYNHPWTFGDFAVDEDGNVVLVDSLWGKGEEPDQIHARVSTKFDLAKMRYVVAGTDLNHELKARGEKGPTLKEFFTRRGWKILDATVSRKSGLNNLRMYIAHEATNDTPAHEPRFVMMDTSCNRGYVYQRLAMMQIDPKEPEDALKVDATGKMSPGGYPSDGDDPYDMVRYALMSRPIAAKEPAPGEPGQDHAKPVDFGATRQRPRQTAQEWLDSLLAKDNPPSRFPHNRNRLPRWK